METLKALATRKSVRKYADKPVSEETIRAILSAGMSGPSAVNARPYSFIVVTDKALLAKMGQGGPAGRVSPVVGAAFAVLVCGDMEKAFKPQPNFWIIDASIAAQNMILAAHDLGVGSVWLGTWPDENNIRRHQENLGLPETIIPHSLIAFGYPEEPNTTERDLYEAEKVHYNGW